MLSDYVNKYAKAWQNGDKETMRAIEKDLAQAGMDKYTLRIAAKEVIKSWKDRQQTGSS
ncbi:MAG: hypothetical protein IJ711_00120 [Lachnospiraceae bacterium]|nr:hypothetical protein [Clostridia bacterium]MBR1691160.1 hypothetical protein [Lachnospiraceae bacterium]